ncbi:hypothetical protein [Mesorhizobium sophorae]|uniref:hypothetical protein n=1 Tax=Mesorhizobium sophorae TaxID=1300294 RepID=UPI000BA3D46C|nr:hypothetical protein [Mesorhizobium sophorae]
MHQIDAEQHRYHPAKTAVTMPSGNSFLQWVNRLKPRGWGHITKAIALETEQQVRIRHPFYDGLLWLVPEVFDDAVREELELSGALPGWASELFLDC